MAVDKLCSQINRLFLTFQIANLWLSPSPQIDQSNSFFKMRSVYTVHILQPSLFDAIKLFSITEIYNKIIC